MMVKLYDKNFREEDLKDLKSGDVIVYPSSINGYDNYLIVKSFDGDRISGTIASTDGVNSISVKDIVSACDL